MVSFTWERKYKFPNRWTHDLFSLTSHIFLLSWKSFGPAMQWPSLHPLPHSDEKLVLLSLAKLSVLKLSPFQVFSWCLVKTHNWEKTLWMKNMGNSLGYDHQPIQFSRYKTLCCSFLQTRTWVESPWTSNMEKTGEIVVLHSKHIFPVRVAKKLPIISVSIKPPVNKSFYWRFFSLIFSTVPLKFRAGNYKVS